MSNINSSKITNLEFETRGKRILEEAKKIIDLAIKENEEYEKANERKFYDISNLSKTTFFLKSCYNEIGYNNISCGGRVAVYWASRFFALFGFNDSDSETLSHNCNLESTHPIYIIYMNVDVKAWIIQLNKIVNLIWNIYLS